MGAFFLKPLSRVFAFSCLSYAAHADDLDYIFALSFEELLNVKVKVATLEMGSALRAPSSVTVFTRSQILNMGVRSVEELLNYVPGYQASRETFNNQGYRVGARGMITPQPSQSVLFIVDGQRLNSDMAGGALLANRFLTTANIERIEVIRGPGAAIYGSSAFSGVVDITTLRDANSLYVASGNIGSKEANLHTNVERDKWKTSLFARFYSDDGQTYGADLTGPIDPLVTSTHDPYTAVDGYLTISWDERFRVYLRHADRDLDDFFDFQFVQDGVAKAKASQNSIALDADLVDEKT